MLVAVCFISVTSANIEIYWQIFMFFHSAIDELVIDRQVFLMEPCK